MEQDVFRDPAVPLSPEQLEMRKLVLKQALSSPETFWMGTWEATSMSGRFRPEDGYCGTTRCVAGWAQFFARGAVYKDGDAGLGIHRTGVDAVRLLGLTEREFYPNPDDAGLFYICEEEAVRRLRELAAVEA
jgi:hypothetical protein